LWGAPGDCSQGAFAGVRVCTGGTYWQINGSPADPN